MMSEERNDDRPEPTRFGDPLSVSREEVLKERKLIEAELMRTKTL